MITEKTWEEFRKTGLLCWMNMILHVFGWALVYEYDIGEKIIGVYPARVKYRGFSAEQIENGYKQISSYLARNADELEREAYGR